MTVKKANTKRVLRKGVAVFLSALMILTAWVFVAPEKASAADTWSGTISDPGTEYVVNGSTVHIYSARALVWFINRIYNGNDFSGVTVYLDVDVDLNSQDFVGKSVFPYSDSRYFRGTFDGQDHTISNFKMTDNNHRVAMFRQTENATFRNVTFTNVNISSSGDYSGHAVLVGYHKSGDLTFENVHINSGSISGYRWMGALAGEIAENSGHTLTLTGCSNGATITGRNTRIGGLAGSCLPAVNATNCSNTGNVTSNSTDVGGIVGWIEDDASSFVSCSNSGAIRGTDAVGGIMGYFGSDGQDQRMTLRNNINEGEIYCQNNRAGGIAGHLETDNNAHIIDGNINRGKVTGGTDTGGIVGRNKGYGTWTNNKNYGEITSTGDNVGGICGEIEDDNQTFTDCENHGVVTGKYSTGGILGYGPYQTHTFTRCSNDANVYSTDGTAGGIFGYGISNPVQGNFYTCTNTGDISGVNYAGGIAGRIGNKDGDRVMTFENCTNEGDVTVRGNSSEYDAGGIVGQIYSDSTHIFTNCSNYGSIVCNGEAGGGVCGKNYGGGTWTNCHNYGTVYVGVDNAGGLIGEIEDTDVNTFSNCSNHADISGANSVGGIFGYGNNAAHTFTNCTNEGNITSRSSYYAGGILGFNNGITRFTECWNIGNISATKDAGGIAGQVNNQSYFTRCWNGGDVGCYNGDGHDYSYGGLIGYTSSGGSTGTQAIVDCYNWGSVTGGNVGGLVGYANGSYVIKYSYNTGFLSGSRVTYQFCGVGGSCGDGCYKNVNTGSGTYKTDQEFIDYNFSIDNNFKKNTEGVTIHGVTYYFPILGWCEHSMPAAEGQCRHTISWTAHYVNNELYYTCDTCGVRMDSECPITDLTTTDLPTSSGSKLHGNTIYNVTGNTTISGSTSSSGLIVDGNSTVVIYIPSGVTLTVNGGSGSGSTSGKAGIFLPTSSTLIIAGNGTLKVNGGSGARGTDGTRGQNGGSGSSGSGSAGGAGGGGGGAGIGGNGGNGGSGGSGGASNGGNAGSGGGRGSSGGKVLIINSISPTLSNGSGGGAGTGQGSGSRSGVYNGGGGGAGGGGGGGAAAIGGGAGGGGGGGSGGGSEWSMSYKTSCEGGGGYGGNGGKGANNGTNGTNGGGGSRNSGGGSGSAGTAGTCVGSESSVSSSDKRVEHFLIKFVFLNKQDGQNDPDIVKVHLFESLPSVTVPVKTGYTFGGYYSAKNGGGTKYINADGTSAHAADFETGELYAKWTANTYTVAYNGNGSTDGSTASSTHTYDEAKNLTANGFEREYTVTYNANGGTCGTASDTATATFSGWATSSGGAKVYDNSQSVINLASAQGATVDLYAKWGAMSSVTLPTATKDYDENFHYTFDGWYDASSGGNRIGGANDSYTPSANKTLYAHYTETAHSFDYSHATFNWSDYSCSNATVECGLEGGHSSNINTSVTSAVTTEPGYDAVGVKTYTAKFTKNSVEYTDTKAESVPALKTLIDLDDIALEDVQNSGKIALAPSKESDINFEIVGFNSAGNHTLYKSGSVPSTTATLKLEGARVSTVSGDTSKIAYKFTKMDFTDLQSFYALVKVTGTQNHKYVDSEIYTWQKVTLVPAKNVFFDDTVEAITYTPSANANSGYGLWSRIIDDGSTVTDTIDSFGDIRTAQQSTENSVMYSFGDAHKVSVSNTLNNKWPKAQFTFTGSGFDLISVTDSNSGVFAVDVYRGADTSGTRVKGKVVDNYYGYTYTQLFYNQRTHKIVSSDDANGTVLYSALSTTPPESRIFAGIGTVFYTIDAQYAVKDDQNNPVVARGWLKSTSSDVMYQVPCISLDLGTVDTYTVVIEPRFTDMFGHYNEDANGAKYYNLILDGIRIYNPADGNNEALEMYAENGETYTSYELIREEASSVSSIVIDGKTLLNKDEMNSYLVGAPKNELYLMPGGTAAFDVDFTDLTDARLGLKAENGSACSVTITKVEDNESVTPLTPQPITISSATEKYVSLKSLLTSGSTTTITVTNSGSGILSLTKLMVTSNSPIPSDEDEEGSGILSVSSSTAPKAFAAVRMLNADIAIDEETVETTSSEDGTVTITLQTGEDAQTVVVRDADGNIVDPDSIDFTIDETGVKNWTIVLTEESEGEFTYTLQAEYENGYTGNAEPTTVNVSVTFPTDDPVTEEPTTDEPADEDSTTGKLSKFKGFFLKLIEFIKKIINLFRK